MKQSDFSEGDSDFQSYQQAMILMGLRSGERFQAIHALDLVTGEDSRAFGGQPTLRIGAADYDPLQEWLTTSYQIHLPSDFPEEDLAEIKVVLKRINDQLNDSQVGSGLDGSTWANLVSWLLAPGYERCARKARMLYSRYYTDWQRPPSVNLDACAWRLGLLGFLPPGR